VINKGAVASILRSGDRDPAAFKRDVETDPLKWCRPLGRFIALLQRLNCWKRLLPLASNQLEHAKECQRNDQKARYKQRQSSGHFGLTDLSRFGCQLMAPRRPSLSSGLT
jgi:hypothetical protein